MTRCTFCGKQLDLDGPITRNDVCPYCGRDLHCCLQCRFYDPGSYNECKEVSAERVVDKERANFCDYFVIRGEKQSRSGKEERAKQALEQLFKKK
ncbi:MAG: hypothetical protein ACOC6E_01280 [Thermodesulfobacteriota bacterium]